MSVMRAERCGVSWYFPSYYGIVFCTLLHGRRYAENMEYAEIILLMANLFRNVSVGTMYGIVTSTRIPIVILFNGVPLFRGAVVVDIGQSRAIRKSRIVDKGNLFGDCDRSQRGTAVESVASDF